MPGSAITHNRVRIGVVDCTTTLRCPARPAVVRLPWRQTHCGQAAGLESMGEAAGLTCPGAHLTAGSLDVIPIVHVVYIIGLRQVGQVTLPSLLSDCECMGKAVSHVPRQTTCPKPAIVRP